MNYFQRIYAIAPALMLSAACAQAALPAGWGDLDIGLPGIAGSAWYADGVWYVAGGGVDIWNTSDQFNYLTNSLSGDGAVVACVTSQTPTDPWAQAGIMIRNDISSNAPEVSLMLTPSNGISFRYRYTAGGLTYQVNQTGIVTPEWIRLSRSTNTFTATYSPDGINWTELGASQTVSMSNSVLAGLAVTAHNNSLISTGAFTGVYIVPGAQAGVPSSVYNPYTGFPALSWETTWPLPQLNVVSNALTPRMGWNCYFVVGVNEPGPMESIIKQTADALVTNGLAAVGYKYEVIDGSWIATGRGYRNTNGDLIVTNSYWPDGMQAVANYVHADGLLMGGYSDIGSPGYGNPAQIGLYAYYQHDADEFASWGWDFIKIDDHGPGDFYAACNAVLNNAYGRPMVLSLSTPQVPGVQFANRIANSYRVANDISFVMGNVTWSSILTEFDADQARWFSQAPGHWNDPDMLCTGLYGISDLEGRSHFNMWCILGAPLMIGTDVRMSGTPYYAPLLTQATLNTLTNTEVIAVDQDPLGAVGRPVAGSTSIYAKPLGSFTSGQYAVLLLNRTSVSNSFTVNWSDIGLTANSMVSVRDLWAHQTLGSFAGGYTATNIPPHGSVILTISGTYNWSQPRVYVAASAYNTFSGTAYYIPNAPAFSSGTYVTGVGGSVSNLLQFNEVEAPSNGLYEVDIYYASSVARSTLLSVDGGIATDVSFPATGGDTNLPGAVATYLRLNVGVNALLLSNPTASAPSFDKIVVSRGTPSGLTANAGDGQVQLSWTPTVGAVTFNIYRGTTSSSEGATPIATGLTTTNFTDSAVINGKTYFYMVTAIVPVLGGESPPSVEVNATPFYVTSSLAYQAAILAANPVAYWQLNETNGTIAYDVLGNFNGIYGTNVGMGAAGPRPANYLGFTLTNMAAQFTNNVSNSWVTLPALNLNTNAVTMTAWVYPIGAQVPFTGLVFYRSGTTVAGMNYDSTGMNLGYTWNNDQDSWGWNSGVQLPVNQWSFIAMAVQPSSTVLYVVNTNGMEAATNFLDQPNEPFEGAGTIGTDTYSSSERAFNGLVDHIAIFNHTLSMAQLQQFYANGSKLSQVQLGFENGNSGLSLKWPQGTLLQTTNLNGLWSRASSDASPFNVVPTNVAMFYRVGL